MSNQIWRLVSVVFGILVAVNGLMNIFRGNDQTLGVAMLMASLVYFPPVEVEIHRILRIRLHYSLKIILGLLIIWISLAVGAINEGYYPELF